MGMFVNSLSGYSNPPPVWQFLREIREKWVELAQYLGFPKQVIDSVKTSSMRSVEQAHHHFLRAWLVPDCDGLVGTLHKMAEKAKLLCTAASGGGIVLAGCVLCIQM